MARAVAAAIPVLETARLILRAPRIEDWPAYQAMLTSDRARHIGGPFTPVEAWRDFSTDVAGWLLRGYGAWSIEIRETGAFAGVVILHQPVGDPERELGFVLLEAAEGHGYAREAAEAARDYAFGVLGWSMLVSYIDRRNARSIRLAERLGARRDDAAPKPLGADGRPEETCLVYRHPAPEAAR